MHYSVNKKSLVRVFFLLPRYMCNIVQKCPMFSLPVVGGWWMMVGTCRKR